MSQEINQHILSLVKSFSILSDRISSSSDPQLQAAQRTGLRSSKLLLDYLERSSRRCSRRRMSIEQDFTTANGTSGDLKCPFANGQSSLPSSHPPVSSNKPSSIIDPITAEFHPPAPPQDSTSSHPSARSAASQSATAFKCPIRFLDQHSPEEVAQYFEKHKHEIPRSHEVCVKRYQSNTESIRQLDAKYGNLVNMIQGLGHKHQPMLPLPEDGEGEGEGEEQEEVGRGRVERWKEDISASIVEKGGEEGVDRDDDEERYGRSLKEIRVGESPSRPWGISVPPVEPSKIDLASFREEEAAAPVPRTSSVKMDRQAMAAHPSAPPVFIQADARPQQQSSLGKNDGPSPSLSSRDTVDQQQQYAKGGPSMVFTGPVFIGYSVDQATQLLKNFNWSPP